MFLKTFIRNSSRNWVHRPPPIETEKFAEQFRSKSALKLLELNDRYKFLQPGARVLDLGASPGGWSEVAAKAVESTEAKPLVLGVDIISCLPLKGANFIIADVTKEETPSEIMKAMKHPADVVLSDLSEPLNYDIDIDCIISVSLCLDVIRIANFTLKPGGCMLIKLFIGNEEPKHYESIKQYFKTVERVKPIASSTSKREIFYYAQGWKLNKPQTTTITRDDIKSTLDSMLSAGIKIDKDIETLLRAEIGDFDFNNPKYKEPKDDDDDIEPGKYTFNQKVPENFEEMEKIVKESNKKFDIDDIEDLNQEQKEEEEYQNAVTKDLEAILKDLKNNPMDSAIEEIDSDLQYRSGFDILYNQGVSSFDYTDEMYGKSYFTGKKTKRKEATHEFNHWEDAGKDSEFWNN